MNAREFAEAILQRLQGRRGMNTRTALSHPDEKSRRQAKAYADAYGIAIDDVKRMMEDL